MRSVYMKKPDIKNIFSAEGVIGSRMEAFEDRPQQSDMAREISELIFSSGTPPKIMLCEAGTGIGKSLAYLVPFIYWAKESGGKAVISTYTKTLQEQLTAKDLPFLEQALPVKFKFALCLGSENYVCLRRLKQSHQYSLFDTVKEVEQYNCISHWAKQTLTGLRLELDFEPLDKLWFNVCREPDLCLNRKCVHAERCFYMKARKEQAEADILVSNHHLFFTNIAGGGKLLPPYGAVVFDEAHNLEEVASEYLGMEVSNSGIDYLAGRIHNPASGKGLISRLKNVTFETREKVETLAEELRQKSGDFFASVLDKLGSEPVRKKITKAGVFEDTLGETLKELCSGLKQAAAETESEDDRVELKAYGMKLSVLGMALKSFIGREYDDFVYWVEISTRGRKLKVQLNITPVDISETMKEKVYGMNEITVLTSATLTANGNFDFIKERLGISPVAGPYGGTGTCVEKVFDSPFDFRKNALMFLPGRISDPSYEYAKFQSEAAELTAEIIEILKGRTFVLFTSYKSLEYASRLLSERLEGIQIIKQGETPRRQMLKNFKANENTVLLGVNTFWQGIDIPGRALECVIIFKLPFTVPDDPVIEARMEHIAKQNKDPFMNYQLPLAAIMLKQGFGRLIRTQKDRGVVAILDPRLKTRFYGSYFLNSLSPCTVTHSIDDIRKFFE